MKILITLITTIVFLSCKQQPEYSSFDIIQALPRDKLDAHRIHPVKSDEDLFSIAYTGVINDDYLVVAQIFKEDGIFQIYKLPNLEFLYSWGRQGEGPGEIPGILVWNSINIKNGELIVYDTLSRLQYFTVSDTAMINTKVRPISYIYSDGIMNGLSMLRDDLFIINNTDHDQPLNEFIAFDPDQREELNKFGKFPETQVEGDGLKSEFFKITASKPDGSKLVSFYIRHNKFKIFNSSLEEEYAFSIMDSSINEPAEMDTDSRFIYKSFIYTTDKYIYALAYNTTMDFVDESEELFKPVLEVWDWHGRPVYHAEFDSRIIIFAVSEKYGSLYGLSDYDPFHIYEYNLSGLIDISEDAITVNNN